MMLQSEKIVISIDGSSGEGGGQVLRSALALSMLTGQAFRITGIRGKRPKPGLLRQHLTAVMAAAEVCDAEVSAISGKPLSLGEAGLTFRPGPVRAGDYSFGIGTAGSVILVLQTILPALQAADRPSRVTIEGGTHAKSAPPFEFFDQCFLPHVNALGARVSATLVKHGFYPAGGGSVRVEVDPVPAQPSGTRSFFDLTERGALLEARGHAIVANLPGRIAVDENEAAKQRLQWQDSAFTINHITDSTGPGNVQLLTARFEHSTEIVAGFGTHGVSARRVATQAARRMQGFLDSGAAIGPYLADQLLLPLAMAGGGRFSTVRPSLHCLTNAQIVQRFTGCTCRFESYDGRELVTVNPVNR